MAKSISRIENATEEAEEEKEQPLEEFLQDAEDSGLIFQEWLNDNRYKLKSHRSELAQYLEDVNNSESWKQIKQMLFIPVSALEIGRIKRET